MPHYLVRKLNHWVCLSADDKQILKELARDVTWFRSNQDAINEGITPRYVSAVLEGWACCYKQLNDGRRHIIAYSIPGDFCNTSIIFSNDINYSVRAMTPVRIARIDRQGIRCAMERSPVIAHAFWLDILATAAIQREWTANIGLRTARERIAHLICEIVIRMQAVGLTDQDSYTLPLTQEDLGETVGLSTVHVNRTLQDLRASGLIEWKRRHLNILNFQNLSEVAHFDDSYLYHSYNNLDIN